jgi:hypothetical protein
VEKLLEHFTKGDSASALAQRRVLNDIGVTSQSGAPNAASARAAGPLSGRRSKPPAAKPSGSKVSDGDLLTSMVQRLNGLERKMAEQRNLLVEKDAEIAELRARQEERNDDARLVEELTDENIKLKRRQLEMEKFLADYGLGAHTRPTARARRNHPVCHSSHLRFPTAWVGDGGVASQGGGSGEKKPVETDLVPLVAPGQVVNDAATGSSGGSDEKQPVSLGRKLGDGSYVPAPAQPPGEQQRTQQEPRAGSSATEENSDALTAQNEGTIAEFDLSKILRHINELNYLVRRCAHAASTAYDKCSGRSAAGVLSYCNRAAKLNCHFPALLLARDPGWRWVGSDSPARGRCARASRDGPATFDVLPRWDPDPRGSVSAIFEARREGVYEGPAGWLFPVRFCICTLVQLSGSGGCASFPLGLKACRILVAQVRAEVRVP